MYGTLYVKVCFKGIPSALVASAVVSVEFQK